MSKGRLFFVSGPTGSGKDTVLVKFFARCPEVRFSISSITRPMREGEVEGEKYNFISREKFEEMLKADQLLEHNVFVGNYYGTPKAPVIDAIEHGLDMIIEVDVNGAAQIKEKMPDAVSVFIMPPSLQVLKSRLSGRGTESEELVEKRLGESLREIKCASGYDYIIVNDVLETAVDELVTIVHSDRLRTVRRIDIVEEVLK